MRQLIIFLVLPIVEPHLRFTTTPLLIYRAGAIFAGSGEWLGKAPLPEGVSDHVSIAVGATIYTVGGVSGTGAV